ncbi:MAG TPA: preprotein translocase subunit YajC [Acidimicrobiales bacterium]
MPNLIFLMLIAVVFYTLLVRGPRQRARRRQEVVAAMGVGDEVVTIGGIVGRIAAVDGDRVALEVAPGVTLTFLRAGINRRIEPVDDSPGESGDAVDLTGGGADLDASGDDDLGGGDLRDGTA